MFFERKLRLPLLVVDIDLVRTAVVDRHNFWTRDVSNHLVVVRVGVFRFVWTAFGCMTDTLGRDEDGNIL